MNDRTLAGHDVAFLVLYPTGAVSQSFLPGLENEIKARQHAQQFDGLVVALPVVADFRTGPLPSAYEGEAAPRPANKPNITSEPEPADGSTLRITSGSNRGHRYTRFDAGGVRAWGSDTRLRWWDEKQDRYRLWIDVQQAVGQADWEVRSDDGA